VISEVVDWSSLVCGEDTEFVTALKSSADSYACLCADGSLEVLWTVEKDGSTRELATILSANSGKFREIAQRDGSVVGWTRALLAAALDGGSRNPQWLSLLKLGQIFAITCIALDNTGQDQLPWRLSAEGCSLHALGYRLTHSRSGTISDGRNRFRLEPLYRVPIANGSIIVNPHHAIVKDLMLAGYVFPDAGTVHEANMFPFTDPRHTADIFALRDGAVLLERTWPHGASMVADFGCSFMPVASPNSKDSVSLSSEHFPGWIVASLDSPLYMAECLVHEASHNLLYEVLREQSLFVEEIALDHKWYSPWRPDPRPLDGLLHACFVFNNVLNMYGRLAISHASEEDVYAARRRLGIELQRVAIGLDTLERSNGLTEVGSRLIAELAIRAQYWSRKDLGLVSPEDLRAINDHRSKWQTAYPQYRMNGSI
jgi:hypothetical protein